MEGEVPSSEAVRRFMRYVTVASQSDPHNEGEVPSAASEHNMASLLAEELRALGCNDVVATQHAYVTAAVPASPTAADRPALGLIAHIDTAPAAPGDKIRPHVVRYEGGDLVAGTVDGVRIVTTPEDVPDLSRFVGSDIICSDGTTLLGADDKAGVAEIMTLVARLQATPTLPHPPLRIAFVPDEEIGHGAALLDLERFGAAYAYTVDGGALGELNYECFNAALAQVTITGVAAHTGDAKGTMVNAITLAAEYDRLLPALERPEHTEGREGFYHAEAVAGSAASTKLTYLLRDFDADGMRSRIATLQAAAEQLNSRYGSGTASVCVREQYRNMAERLADKSFLIERALAANRAVGIDPQAIAVRGGTDGAQLTFRGLPCPNLATGGYAFHSVREFIPARSLDLTVDMLEHLVALFA